MMEGLVTETYVECMKMVLVVFVEGKILYLDRTYLQTLLQQRASLELRIGPPSI